MNIHEKYMSIALQEAEKGRGRVNPNPLVGAVIVKNKKIIARGYHQKFGGAHAERNVLNAVTQNPAKATLYVTLEPCCFHGKTPPCTEAIIKSKIGKVVMGALDPNPLVAGKGKKELEENGIEVISGVLENKAKEQNKVFFKFIQTGLPYVVMKTAMTLDGKIATKTGHSQWISCKKSREYVHKMRRKYMGIMVGVNTVIQDNPRLTCRLKENVKQPVRIIVDSHGKTPEDSHVLDTTLAPTFLITTNNIDEKKQQKFQQKGVEVIISKKKDEKIDLSNMVKILGEKGIDSILLEGGGILNFSALQEGIVDEFVGFIAPKMIGGNNAKTVVEGEGVATMNEAFLFDKLSFFPLGNDGVITARILRK